MGHGEEFEEANEWLRERGWVLKPEAPKKTNYALVIAALVVVFFCIPAACFVMVTMPAIVILGAK